MSRSLDALPQRSPLSVSDDWVFFGASRSNILEG